MVLEDLLPSYGMGLTIHDQAATSTPALLEMVAMTATC